MGSYDTFLISWKGGDTSLAFYLSWGVSSDLTLMGGNLVTVLGPF